MTRPDRINDVVAAFGRSSNGIEFDALDNAPVKFVVLFIVPKNQFQTHLRTLVDTPAIGRGMSERLNEIIAELDQLEGRQVKTVHDQFSAIVAEQKADNARTQREYAREWEWQMSGMQTSPPSGVDLFRRD